MLMKSGDLFYSGTAEHLLASMQENVWRCLVPRNMVDRYLAKYLVGNIKATGQGVELYGKSGGIVVTKPFNRTVIQRNVRYL